MEIQKIRSYFEVMLEDCTVLANNPPLVSKFQNVPLNVPHAPCEDCAAKAIAVWFEGDMPANAQRRSTAAGRP